MLVLIRVFKLNPLNSTSWKAVMSSLNCAHYSFQNFRARYEQGINALRAHSCHRTLLDSCIQIDIVPFKQNCPKVGK